MPTKTKTKKRRKGRQTETPRIKYTQQNNYQSLKILNFSTCLNSKALKQKIHAQKNISFKKIKTKQKKTYFQS